jgi:predicted dithiol-disulfide oxidoreductase (DUF899 family)
MAYDGYYLTYKADKETNERFDEIRQKYPSFRMVKINLEDFENPKVEEAINKIASIANTKHFWVVDPDVKVDNDFDFSFETDNYNDDITHLWNCDERNVFRRVVGVKLFKTKEVLKNKASYIRDAYFLTGEYKDHDSNVIYKPTTETYDIFFWDKGYGYKELKKLQENFTINLIEGENSVEVHEKCREKSRTDFYYLIMPNTKIYDSFKFDYSFAFGLDKEKQKVVVWQKENPETKLTREYHGVGLFPRNAPMFTEKEYDIFNFKRKAVYEKEPACSDLPFEVIRTTDLHTFQNESESDMYWLVHPDVTEFNPEFYPFSYDRMNIHNFNVLLGNGKVVRNGVRLLPTINPSTDRQKDVDQIMGEIPTTELYDIFFWDKGYGYKELEKLKEKYKVNAVKGKSSIDVHKKCRKQSKTKFYYLIMPNTKIYDSFKFDYTFSFGKGQEKQGIVVWQKENPETKLSREYHGIGLFPKTDKLLTKKEYDIFNFKRNAVYEKEPACSDLPFEVIRTTDLHTFQNESESDMYWLVHPDVTGFDSSFYPMIYDRTNIHNFNVLLGNGKVVRNGVRLVPTINPSTDRQKDVDQVMGEIPTTELYDIFFWDKGYGYKELEKLKEKHTRVKTVKGKTSLAVHKKCRKQSKTKFYYLIMPDTKIYDSFKFDYSFAFGKGKEKQGIVVWPKQNPITNHSREFNGVGLFPKTGKLFAEEDYDIFDFKREALYEKEPACSDLEFEVIRTTDLHSFDHKVDSDMYWLVHEDVEDFSTDFYPFSYDREFIHNFNVKIASGGKVRNGVRLVPHTVDKRATLFGPKEKDVDTVVGRLPEIQKISARTIEEAVPQATEHNFWMINPDLTETSTISNSFYPDLYDTGPTHLWKFSTRDGEKDLGYGGVALSNIDYHPENIIFHDEYASRVSDKKIPTYHTRDPYSAYQRAKKHVFYWVVDTVVELLDTFSFDFYPDIFSIENVFAFKSEGDAGAGVYLVHRPHLASFKPSKEDFSFDRFKNIIRVDEVASKVTGHPVFYFDEGMYSANTEKYKKDKTVEVLTGTLEECYMKAAKLTNSGYFWAIDNDVEVLDEFDRRFYVDRHHASHFHVWPKVNPSTGYIHQYGGLKLIPAEAVKYLKPDNDKLRKMTFKNKKPIKSESIRTQDIPYDVVMLSYKEPEADANFAKLLERVPNAKRVHGVKGIFNAHQRASEIADTKMFYVIDADAILLDDFKFEYFPTVWDEDTVHVWKSKNPINGLVYGFGGLKLFPTQLVRDAKEWKVDFTTSISDKFKAMPGTANYTAFNTNPYDTWKSAFRECTKLSSSIIQKSKKDETDERLETWCTINNGAKYGEYAIAGAKAGRDYGTKHADDEDALSKINDYDWLHQKFEENTNGK